MHTWGSCNNSLLRRVLRRLFKSKCFLKEFFEGAGEGFSVRTRFLEACLEGSVGIESAEKGEHVLSQSTTPPSACTQEKKFNFQVDVCLSLLALVGDLKITSTSTERQKRCQILAPVLVIISGNSLVFSRKIITSTGFYRCCAPGTSAPVVVKKSAC